MARGNRKKRDRSRSPPRSSPKNKKPKPSTTAASNSAMESAKPKKALGAMHNWTRQVHNMFRKARAEGREELFAQAFTYWSKEVRDAYPEVEDVNSLDFKTEGYLVCDFWLDSSVWESDWIVMFGADSPRLLGFLDKSPDEKSDAQSDDESDDESDDQSDDSFAPLFFAVDCRLPNTKALCEDAEKLSNIFDCNFTIVGPIQGQDITWFAILASSPRAGANVSGKQDIQKAYYYMYYWVQYVELHCHDEILPTIGEWYPRYQRKLEAGMYKYADAPAPQAFPLPRS